MEPRAGSSPEPVTGTIEGIPRYRPTRLPALFSQGFRPFFLAACLWSPLSLLLWLLQWSGLIEIPTGFDPVAWHAHEMIFGFAAAAMAGFLMTSIPNWTGRMPIQGVPLLVLAGSWLLGRIAVATSALIGALPAAIVDLSFPVLLILAMGREIVVGRNWRNLPMIAALSLLLIANAVMHLAASGQMDGQIGVRIGIAVFGTLVAMVGGRIIPSFTRNRLAKMNTAARPAAFDALDRVALVLVPAGLASWVVALDPRLTAALLLLAAAATAARLFRWQGLKAIGDASLWAMHLGYAWLATGLALIAGSEIWPSVPPMAGLHALTAGAIGTTILAVMSRATLSHTGRRSSSMPGSSLVFALITIAALSRVIAAFASGLYLPLLWIAGLAWILAFAIFAVLHAGPLLTSKRSSR